MRKRQDGLNPNQAAILKTIEAAVRRYGQAPTIREIGAAVDILSLSHVEYLLRGLEEQGYIVRERGKSHGIRLAYVPGVPILGRIAAGEPLDVYEETQHAQLDLGAHVRSAGSEDEYALVVRGDSMIEDHIFDGDYVLVRPAHDAPNNTIVVALRHDAATSSGAVTVKRFHREARPRRVRLQPANSALEPIIISAADWAREWEIQGIVTAIYRPCH